MDRTSVGHNIDVPLSLTPSVQNDIYIYMSFTLQLYFFHACFLQRNFPQMFYIPRHMNPENFMQIGTKNF